MLAQSGQFGAMLARVQDASKERGIEYQRLLLSTGQLALRLQLVPELSDPSRVSILETDEEIAVVE
jgi:hypothetical protein